MRGAYKFFNADRHFGFILPDYGSPDIFYHGSVVQGTAPKDGDTVFYELGPVRPDGKIRAAKVRLA